MKQMKSTISYLLCTLLIALMALGMAGCRENSGGAPSPQGTEASSDTAPTVLGEGETTFALSVVDQGGGETRFEIHTDKGTVGEALLGLGLIEGEVGSYGLYVSAVNGVTADYDRDGVYWAFYINDQYANTGVDATAIVAGDSYAFKVIK